MTVIGLVLLFHICAKYGVIWNGVAVAWIFAMFIDAALYAWIVYCIFEPIIN